ncbi:MAG TPA: ATP-dependent DNA helicase RecG, partial [Luteibacter sp.]|nr:ATP-dependent DNA helicase RecG [Luteibacter sp.]
MARSAATTPAVPTADPGRAPLTTLGGVGPALADTLARLGLRQVQDLWFHLPLRYEDRTTVVPIRDLRPGDRAQVEGIVEHVERGFRFRPQLKVIIGDDSGGVLLLRFFHFRKSQV